MPDSETQNALCNCEISGWWHLAQPLARRPTNSPDDHKVCFVQRTTTHSCFATSHKCRGRYCFAPTQLSPTQQPTSSEQDLAQHNHDTVPFNNVPSSFGGSAKRSCLPAIFGQPCPPPPQLTTCSSPSNHECAAVLCLAWSEGHAITPWMFSWSVDAANVSIGWQPQPRIQCCITTLRLTILQTRSLGKHGSTLRALHGYHM